MPYLSEIDIAYLLLFASTLLLVEGIFYVLKDTRGAALGVNRRLRLLAAGKSRNSVLGSLRRADLDPVSALLARLLPWMERLIREAGLVVTLRRLLGLCALIALVVGATLSLTTAMPPGLSAMSALFAGLGIPTLVLIQRRRARLKHFGEQLPEILEMMVRSLRSGHPIAAAIGMVATEMADPAGSEFGIVVDEMTYGFDLDTALRNLASRLPHPDLGFFLVAVQIQHQTGGNLSDVLSNLASVIRDRFTLVLKIKTITAQGRSGAFVIGCTPLVTSFGIHLLNGRYFNEVADDPMFTPTLAIAAVLWITGLVIIHRLVHFRI